MKLVAKEARVATTERVVKQLVQMPRCAVEVRPGVQCSGTVGGTGRASGYRNVDGERVPLCQRHYGL